MSGLKLVNHLNGSAAGLRNLIDIRSHHKPEVDISVTKAIGCPMLAFTVDFQVQLTKHGIYHLPLRRSKN